MACLTDVALAVSGNFGKPVLAIGLWNAGSSGAIVPVPETAVDEDHLSPAGEHDVWPAGQVFAVKSKTISEPVQGAPDDEFRLGIFGPHGSHDAATDWISLASRHRLPPLPQCPEAFDDIWPGVENAR